jgi:hypothetical protein
MIAPSRSRTHRRFESRHVHQPFIFNDMLSKLAGDNPCCSSRGSALRFLIRVLITPYTANSSEPFWCNLGTSGTIAQRELRGRWNPYATRSAFVSFVERMGSGPKGSVQAAVL